MSAYPRDDTGAACGGRATFHRFTTRNRCPHCDHESPCIFFDSGDILCRREGEAGNWTDSYIGGYWHRTGRDRPWASSARTPAPSTPQIQTVERADAMTLDAVFTRALALWPLSAADRAYLVDKCGHTEAMLAGGYGTFPRQDKQGYGMAVLEEEFGADTLRRVPGIVTDEEGRLSWTLDGLVIAVHDRAGRIQACRVRKDVRSKDGKATKFYGWLSSTKSGGPGSGAPAHVARPLEPRDHRIYVCESEKTANYLTHTLGATVVALAGQGNHAPALEVLTALRDEEGAEVAVVLLDAVDPADPKAVKKEAETEGHRQALALAVSRLGYHVKIGRWAHANGKGPDDVLIGGHTFTRERYTRPADESGHGADLLTHPTEDGMVNVDPRFLAWLIKETAATATLRARYHRVQAILADPIMNDGQKLVSIALTSRLARPRAGGEEVEAVKVCAGTIARDLGSKITIKDGKERPTKQNTVNKILADIVTLGVCTREPVTENRVILKKDDRGHTYEKDVSTTTFRYSDTLSLPGQHIKREDAKDVPTLAKIDRERPRPSRCPHCFSTHLKPASHVCLNCHTVSSDVQVVEAGQMIDDRGNGLFVRRETGEVIVPGVPAYDGDFGAAAAPDGPATPDETQYRNPVSGQTPPSPVAHDSSHADPIPESGYFSTSEQGYRIPVSGQSGTSMMDDEAPTSLKPCGGGCGGLTHRGWPCKACRDRQDNSTTTARREL